MNKTPIHFVRIVLTAAFDANDNPTHVGEVESLADGFAEQLRDCGALTAASEVDDATRELDLAENEDGADVLGDALEQQWPELSDEERRMLDEAIDSHVYWHLSDEHYRNDSAVDDPGSDDAAVARRIADYRSLALKLAGPDDKAREDA